MGEGKPKQRTKAQNFLTSRLADLADLNVDSTLI